MSDSLPIESILIVGGGTAGWLTAAMLAAKHPYNNGAGLQITLVEAPDIPIIGVGEGTWPSMRSTLRGVGIKEGDFLKECQASFKQGSKFVGWKNGRAEDYYYHPFDLPQGFFDVNLAQHWVDSHPNESFSKFACVQEHLCEKDLSPKLKTSAEYAGVANYGYHLDAGKFSEFLKKHCLEKLDVRLVRDKVIEVVPLSNGDIGHVITESSGELAADLFVDCTGFKSLLLGQHYGVGFLDMSDVLPINSALAVQVPYEDRAAIKSATIATAQEAGWIWDIGLANRRGVGHVYSNRHTSEEQARVALQDYLGLDDIAFEELKPRNLSFNPGYREKFWHKNCVGIGLSAGFLEPLEASAMMLIEFCVNMIASQMPANRAAMKVVSGRFNQRTQYRWERIIDFLKLHYALSDRPETFWRDVAAPSSLSARLKQDLELWQHQAPWKSESASVDEAFPAASYQYVLYGMQFETRAGTRALSRGTQEQSLNAVDSVARNSQLLSSKLESNRSLIELLAGN